MFQFQSVSSKDKWIVQMTSDASQVSICVKNEKERGGERDPALLSHLHTSGQSLH